MGISLYTSRVVLASLGVEDYGIYNVVGGIVSLFAFINGAMSLTTQRYISYELGKGKGCIRGTFSTCVMIHILIAVIIILLAETIGLYILKEYLTIPPQRITAAYWVYQFSILSCVTMILSTPYNGAIIAYEKMQAFAYISLLEAILRLMVAFIITYSFFDNLIVYALLLFIIQLIIRICYNVYCRIQIPEIKFHFIFDKRRFKQMLYFSGWTLFNNSSIIACNQGINILLNIFFNPVINAARGIAVQVEVAVSSFSKNFQMALNPQITKNYARNDYSKYYSLIFASSKYSYFFLLFLSIPILSETEYILKLWLTVIPEHTVSFVRIILLVSLVNILTDPLDAGVSATGNIKYYQAVSGTLLIAILPISFFLFKIYSYPLLIFVIYFIMSFIVYLYKLFYAVKKINLPFKKYIKKVMIRITVVSFFSFIIIYYIRRYLPVASFLDFVLSVTLYMSFTLITIMLFGFTKKEKQKIICRIKNIILSVNLKKR